MRASLTPRGTAGLKSPRDPLLHGSLHGPENEHRPTRISAGEAVFYLGVADGTRTRDSQDHNLVLYQLNYSHHCRVRHMRRRRY
jgi:hypothetical protein